MAKTNDDLGAVLVFVEELCKAGVQDVCISPGSRSTPLTAALARHPLIRVWTVLDERSAGFFAYGLARAKRVPAALVCTSGTAPANYFPAVVEAFQSRVPLLVVTADRPPELHGVGSNQTVDQEKLYGTFVKQFFAMPLPENATAVLNHARWMAHRAVAATLSAPMGPVHINWPFREPLLPPVELDHGSGHKEFSAQVHSGTSQFQPHELRSLADKLATCERGLIICGPQDRPELAEPLLRLAECLQFPVLADPLSQLRSSGVRTTMVVDNYDAFLRALGGPDAEPSPRDVLAPQLVIRVGQTPTSKVLGQFLASLDQSLQIVVDESDAWHDPFYTATEVWRADPVQLFAGLAQAVAVKPASAFARCWLGLAVAVHKRVDEFVMELPPLFEGRVWQELAELMPAGSTLFAGNSMPVRDMDTFFKTIGHRVRVIANRGASGIDGLVSSALGASAAEPLPVVLVIGDVSFYHDLNGLLAAKMHKLPLIVVLVHNDGGGIFSFLPQATETDVFPYFATAHGLDFEPAVKMYGGEFRRVESWEEFRLAMANALASCGLQVLELRTSREENVRLHQQVFSACAQVVAEWVRYGRDC